MKRIVLALLPLSVLAADVTPEMAVRAANAWISSSARVGRDATAVTSAVPRVVSGKTLYYVCHRTSGGTVTVASDTGLDPIIAVSAPSRKTGTKVTTPLSAMLDADAGSSHAKLAAVRSSFSGRLFGSAVPRENADIRRNGETWSGLLAAPKLRALKAAPQAPEIVLPGFEDDGGALTHWGQTTATRGFEGTKPVYNYYMHGPADGGAPKTNTTVEASGLGLETGDPDDYPCGCLATSYAACAQYFRAKGMRQETYRCGALVTNTPAGVDYAFNQVITNASRTRLWYVPFVRPLPGAYDWDILPSNYGGSAPAADSEDDLSDAARELLGRVTYNYGIGSCMEYAPDGSGAYGLQVGYDGYMNASPSFVASTLDNCNCNYRQWALGTPYAKDVINMTTGRHFLRACVAMGEPVIFSIESSRLQVGHSTLVVGVAGASLENPSSSALYAKVFMGHGGFDDTWFNANSSTVDSNFTIVRSMSLFGYPDRPAQILLGKNPSVTVGSSASCVTVVATNVNFTVTGNLFNQVKCTWTTNFFRSFPDGTWAVGIPYAGWNVRSVSTADSFDYDGDGLPDNAGSSATYGVLSYTVTSSYAPVSDGVSTYYMADRTWSKNDIPVKPRRGWIFPDENEYGSGRSMKYDMSDVYFGIIIDTNPYYNNAGFSDVRSATPVVTNSTLHVNGYEYGTPQDIGTTARAAFASGKPLVLAYGNDGTTTALDSYLKGLSGVTRYFVDCDTAGGMPGTFALYDSHGLVDEANPLDVDLSPVLAVSSFTNASDYALAMAAGLARYAALDPERPNAYSVAPHRVPNGPGNDNPLAVSASSYNIDNAVGKGYTSIVFGPSVTRVYKNNTTADSTIRFLDFTQCPSCTLGTAPAYALRALVDADLPGNCTAVPYDMFNGCHSLQNLSCLPSGVKTIASYAFSSCTSLVSIAGIDSVTSVGAHAFTYTYSLGSAQGWPDGVAVPEQCFYYSGLTDLDGFPTGTPMLGCEAFGRCRSMTTADIPECVTNVDTYCFGYCTSLKTVRMPKALETVGQHVFVGCTSLTAIDMSSVTNFAAVSFGSSALDAPNAITVTVPVTESAMTSRGYSDLGLASGSKVVCTDGTIEIE